MSVENQFDLITNKPLKSPPQGRKISKGMYARSIQEASDPTVDPITGSKKAAHAVPSKKTHHAKVRKPFVQGSAAKESFNIISGQDNAKHTKSTFTQRNKVPDSGPPAGAAGKPKLYNAPVTDPITGKQKKRVVNKVVAGKVQREIKTLHKNIDPITGKPRQQARAKRSTSGAIAAEIKAQGVDVDPITGKKVQKRKPPRSTSGAFSREIRAQGGPAADPITLAPSTGAPKKNVVKPLKPK